MDNPASTFIPHDASEPTNSRVRRPGGSGLGDLALLLAILAVAASAALAVGVFFYQSYLKTTSDHKLAELQSAAKTFQPELVTQLQRLDERMKSGQMILADHTAPSAFFGILNQITAKTVSYTSLTLNNGDKMTIDMDGVARSVNSVAFQSDLLSKSGTYKSPIFSALSRQKDGVHFHLSAVIDSTSVNFEELTGGGPSVQQPSTTSVQNVPTSPFGGAPQTQ